MVYVDECAIWPTTIACMRGGSCHLTADTIEELHAFAARIGLRRGWAQIEGHRVPHYDLTPARRARAVEAGAVFVPAKEQARRRIAARADQQRPSSAICSDDQRAATPTEEGDLERPREGSNLRPSA